MIIQFKTMDEFHEQVKKSFATNKEYVCYLIQPNDAIVSGLSDLQEEYVNNIKTYCWRTCGGSIVCKKGDVGVSFFIEKESNAKTIWLDFMNSIANWLKEKQINAEFVDNDILVDGCKCSGSSFNPCNANYGFCIIQISLTVDIPLIESVCTKPMKKTPKGLGDYGITTEEVVEFVKGFFETYAQTI